MSTLANRWRKSSRSSNQTNCVEVRHDLAEIRDSKNPRGPVLAVSAAMMQDLQAAVRSGQVASFSS